MKGIQEYRRQQGKVQEVEVLKGWKVGEIGGNYATIFNILLSKNKAKKKGAGAGNARYKRSQEAWMQGCQK